MKDYTSTKAQYKACLSTIRALDSGRMPSESAFVLLEAFNPKIRIAAHSSLNKKSVKLDRIFREFMDLMDYWNNHSINPNRAKLALQARKLAYSRQVFMHRDYSNTIWEIDLELSKL